MLSLAGAPTIESETASDVRLMTGTMWHSYFERALVGRPAMTELKLDAWLPEGWSGTADWLLWNSDRRAFVLGDLKTIKPEGLTYIETEGIKKEHQHQVSLYWYALRNAGFPLIHGYVVYYLPTGPIIGEKIEPLLQEGTPLDEDYLMGLADSRWKLAQVYLESYRARCMELGRAGMGKPLGTPEALVTDQLAPPPEPELRLMWNGQASKAKGRIRAAYELKLMPVWQTGFCPFPDELCDCSTQRPVKVGHWMLDDDGQIRWTFSRGKAGLGIEPGDYMPSPAQIKRIQEANAKGDSSGSTEDSSDD